MKYCRILGYMKELRVVSLMGNPVIKTIKLYRKTMILKCKNLNYLDDRPVFQRDRACAEAWMRGGPSEEEAERKRWIQAEQQKINDSVQALINKRKLYKPVGTSEKEAEDKKKTKEDEEVAKLVCTSNQLLNLEKKNKSAVSSSSGSSASSSSDEEVENEQEDDGTGQKGAEKSDGRRPMAEEERKATGELLLPWRTQTSRSNPPPAKLIEEITEGREYVAGDAERKRLGKQILDERRSAEDPPGGYALGRELAHYEKLVLETSNETEITPRSCANEQKNDDTSGDGKLLANDGVSCNTFGTGDNETPKETRATDSADNETIYKDILDDYRRKGDPHPLSGRLTSIREDMKEFCAGMDKFVENNKIVTADRHEEKRSSAPVKGKDEFRWWSTKERKLKIAEIMRKREEESGISAEEKKGEPEGTSSARKIEIIDDAPEKNLKDTVSRETKEGNEGVYDLLNLKECPKILVHDVKSYHNDKDDAALCEPTKTESKEEPSVAAFQSLFDELDSRDRRNVKREKSHSFHELFVIDESEESVEETREGSNLNRCASSASVSLEIVRSKSNRESIKKEPVRVKIAEATKLTNSDEDESDNESVKTVINLYEGSAKSDQKRETTKNPVNFSDSSTLGCLPKLSETVKLQKNDQGSGRQALDTPVTSPQDEKWSQTSKTRKRLHDNECMDPASKKSHLIEEADSEKGSTGCKSSNDIAERCRQHAKKEAKKFMQKESPLIDRCIKDLIAKSKVEDNWRFRSRDHEEFLTCTAMGLSSSNTSTFRVPDKSLKADSVEDRPQETASVSNVSDVQSIAQLLQQSKTVERHGKSMSKNEADLYKDFCEHLDRLNDKRKLLIEPDFMKNSVIDHEEKKHDALSPRETKQSKKKQTKPLIEVISQESTNVHEIEELEDDPEDSTMDPALKERILKCISTPKSEQQIEKGRKSAEKLMKISREAMAAGKSLLQESPNSCRQLDDSRVFFRNLLKEDAEEETKEISSADKRDVETERKETEVLQDENTQMDEKPVVLSVEDIDKREYGVLDREQENSGQTRKSLEMQIIQKTESALLKVSDRNDLKFNGPCLLQ
nr:dynein assembly factor 1, axonemal homolog [Nomia melanderi]